MCIGTLLLALRCVAEALNKYLELAPNGQHANDAKAILQAVAQK